MLFKELWFYVYVYGGGLYYLAHPHAMFFLLTQPGLASSTSGLQSTLEMYPCLIDLFVVPTGRVLGPSREALNILSSACQDAVPTGRIRVPSRKEVYVLPDVVASGRD